MRFRRVSDVTRRVLGLTASLHSDHSFLAVVVVGRGGVVDI